MSIVIKRASCVEITLLKSIFATSISAVGVATAPGKLILSPPTVSSVRLGSAFSGHIVHTNCPYVTSFICSVGTLCWNINSIVLVGFFILPPMPFANLPNSLADERLHASLYFVLLINCL